MTGCKWVGCVLILPANLSFLFLVGERLLLVKEFE